MALPALDITLPCSVLTLEVRLPSIESPTLSPAKFSFPSKCWPVPALLCLWDLTRLEPSLACLQAKSPCKQQSKCQKAAAEQELVPCCIGSFYTERSRYRCIFPEFVVTCIFPGLVNLSRMQVSSIKENFRHLRIIERKRDKNNFQKTPNRNMINKKKNTSIQLIDSSQCFLSAFIYMQEYYLL